MSVTADVLTTLHQILQFGFIGVTFLLMLVTLVNRLRVRDVVLTWHTGPFFGLPVWPLLFLTAVFGFLVVTLLTEQAIAPELFLGYLLGGVFWFMAGWFSAAVLITERGVLRDANRIEEAIAWEQIVDYFEVGDERTHRFVFFYLDGADHRRRLELAVPPGRRPAFQHLVMRKLDTRYNLPVRQVYGKKALEG